MTASGRRRAVEAAQAATIACAVPAALSAALAVSLAQHGRWPDLVTVGAMLAVAWASVFTIAISPGEQHTMDDKQFQEMTRGRDVRLCWYQTEGHRRDGDATCLPYLGPRTVREVRAEIERRKASVYGGPWLEVNAGKNRAGGDNWQRLPSIDNPRR